MDHCQEQDGSILTLFESQTQDNMSTKFSVDIVNKVPETVLSGRSDFSQRFGMVGRSLKVNTHIAFATFHIFIFQLCRRRAGNLRQRMWRWHVWKQGQSCKEPICPKLEPHNNFASDPHPIPTPLILELIRALTYLPKLAFFIWQLAESSPDHTKKPRSMQ